MSHPFFSIIIPTYNRAHTIRRPINSILAQTFTDWELIIVDDGSTDDTQEIVESYKDPRIRYVWQENQERSAARNHGISLAKGAWICFQDSDDEYLPEHLQVLYEGIQNNAEYKVIRTGLLIYEDGHFTSKTNICKDNIYDLFPVGAFTSATFEKSIFDYYNFDAKINIAEDTKFCAEVYEQFDILVLENHTVICHSDTKGKINYNTQMQKMSVYKNMLKSDLKRSMKAINFQICFISLSMLVHSFKENRKVFNSLYLNLNQFILNPRTFLFSIITYFKIRILSLK